MSSFILLALIALGLVLSLTARAARSAAPPARPLSVQEEAELRALVRSGREIEAVRRHRQLTRASLLEATTQVRQMQR